VGLTSSYDQRVATARLLHRFSFGPTPGQYSNLLKHGLAATQAAVLVQGRSDPGIDSVKPLVLADLGYFPSGNNAAKSDQFWKRISKDSSDLVTWWLDRMVAAHFPLSERMTWFWHGHWATSISSVTYPLTMKKQNSTLRTHALGNFEDMARAMVLDGALNVWLNNNENYVQAPNENLAREFLELMTLGVNNYTQNDVAAAALALTGYSTAQSNGRVTFNPKEHFSVPLGLLGSTGVFDAQSLAKLAVSKKENVQFITDRMWFRFVSGSTSPPASLAESFVQRDISSLVTALVHSSAWTDPANSLVKSPVEWFVGACRALKVHPSQLNAGDTQWLLSQMGQVPFDPPNVGGWTYGTAWMSGVSFQYRFQLAQNIVEKGDFAPLAVQPLDVVQACADWLGVPAWSTRTANALTLAIATPSELALAALLSPEYMVSV
jgi:uncharacterized protein (DUF1800 family)